MRFKIVHNKAFNYYIVKKRGFFGLWYTMKYIKTSGGLTLTYRFTDLRKARAFIRDELKALKVRNTPDEWVDVETH